jgi:hypothetical protein
MATSTHEDLLDLVKESLKKLALDDTVPPEQRINELRRIGYYCNKAVDALCPKALADTMRGDEQKTR